MTNLAVKFLSAVSAGIVASAPIAMIPLSTVGAAEECLTTPKDETPPGKHWYYRIERGTKRHCWFLREEGETSSQAATSTPARRAAPEVAPDRETKLARSAADAHAELPLPQTLVEADLKTSPTTPATSVDPRGAEQKLSNNASPETAQSPVASRWPQPTGVFSSATERPIAPSFVVASAAPDTNLDASADTDLTPKVPPVAPTKVETSATGTPASLQMLLFGTFGVIAVSSAHGKRDLSNGPEAATAATLYQLELTGVADRGADQSHGHSTLARTSPTVWRASKPSNSRVPVVSPYDARTCFKGNTD